MLAMADMWFLGVMHRYRRPPSKLELIPERTLPCEHHRRSRLWICSGAIKTDLMACFANEAISPRSGFRLLAATFAIASPPFVSHGQASRGSYAVSVRCKTLCGASGRARPYAKRRVHDGRAGRRTRNLRRCDQATAYIKTLGWSICGVINAKTDVEPFRPVCDADPSSHRADSAGPGDSGRRHADQSRVIVKYKADSPLMKKQAATAASLHILRRRHSAIASALPGPLAAPSPTACMSFSRLA